MDQAVTDLLLQLNSHFTLNSLPCFYDRPGQIQFRIGLNTGPNIKFSPETEDLYCLSITDGIERHLYWAVMTGDKQLETCQSVYRYIKSLCDDVNYTRFREKNLDTFMPNLVRIMGPVIGI